MGIHSLSIEGFFGMREVCFNPSNYTEATFAQGHKYFRKPSKPCHVGIYWIPLTEYSRVSTHVAGFQSFFRGFLHHFVVAKLANISIRVRSEVFHPVDFKQHRKVTILNKEINILNCNGGFGKPLETPRPSLSPDYPSFPLPLTTPKWSDQKRSHQNTQGFMRVLQIWVDKTCNGCKIIIN